VALRLSPPSKDIKAKIGKFFKKENQFMKLQNKKCIIAGIPEHSVNDKEIKRFDATLKKSGDIF
jgi:hypothetical protein